MRVMTKAMMKVTRVMTPATKIAAVIPAIKPMRVMTTVMRATSPMSQLTRMMPTGFNNSLETTIQGQRTTSSHMSRCSTCSVMNVMTVKVCQTEKFTSQ